MSEEKMDPLVKTIPKNALKTGKFLSFRYRNWIEAIITAYLIGYGIYMTTFVTKIKVICIIILCTTDLIIFLRGIKNRTVIDFLGNIITDRMSRIEYHLGSVNNDRKQEQNQFGGESLLERTIKNVKTKAKKFDDKYGK